MNAGFDWHAVMRAGLQGLGLTPETFWRLTPAEFLMMVGHAQAGPAPMGRAALESLAVQFPDTPKQPIKEDGDE